jgi:pSer/pThr/pTyr-binding forkhead associated (FHA) protein
LSLCPNCGAEVTASMKFCAECGSKLDHGHSTVAFSPPFKQEEEEESAGSGEAAALIELDQVEGTAGRRMHDLVAEKVTVGRSPSSDIFLDDVTVSREHAAIEHGNGGAYRIRDAGSLNGTYVNRVRVDAVDLRNGDEIQVGKYRFKFVFT